MRVAIESKAEDLAPALRDFARGQRGLDMMRNQAAQAARIAGLLPDGPLRLWVQGGWREVEVIGFELHGEAFTRHGPRVEALNSEAMGAMRRGGAVRGAAPTPILAGQTPRRRG